MEIKKQDDKSNAKNVVGEAATFVGAAAVGVGGTMAATAATRTDPSATKEDASKDNTLEEEPVQPDVVNPVPPTPKEQITVEWHQHEPEKEESVNDDKLLENPIFKPTEENIDPNPIDIEVLYGPPGGWDIIDSIDITPDMYGGPDGWDEMTDPETLLDDLESDSLL